MDYDYLLTLAQRKGPPGAASKRPTQNGNVRVDAGQSSLAKTKKQTSKGPDPMAVLKFKKIKEMEERKREVEERRRKEKLLLLRSQNSKKSKAAKMMATRTKDNDFSRIVLNEQERVEKNEIEEKLRQQRIQDPRERMKQRIELENEADLQPKKRKRRRMGNEYERDVSPGPSVDYNRINGNPHQYIDDTFVARKPEKRERESNSKQKSKPPPPLNFDDLLKIAERKQKEEPKPSLMDQIETDKEMRWNEFKTVKLDRKRQNESMKIARESSRGPQESSRGPQESSRGPQESSRGAQGNRSPIRKSNKSQTSSTLPKPVRQASPPPVREERCPVSRTKEPKDVRRPPESRESFVSRSGPKLMPGKEMPRMNRPIPKQGPSGRNSQETSTRVVAGGSAHQSYDKSAFKYPQSEAKQRTERTVKNAEYTPSRIPPKQGNRYVSGVPHAEPRQSYSERRVEEYRPTPVRAQESRREMVSQRVLEAERRQPQRDYSPEMECAQRPKKQRREAYENRAEPYVPTKINPRADKAPAKYREESPIYKPSRKESKHREEYSPPPFKAEKAIVKKRNVEEYSPTEPYINSKARCGTTSSSTNRSSNSEKVLKYQPTSKRHILDAPLDFGDPTSVQNHYAPSSSTVPAKVRDRSEMFKKPLGRDDGSSAKYREKEKPMQQQQQQLSKGLDSRKLPPVLNRDGLPKSTMKLPMKRSHLPPIGLNYRRGMYDTYEDEVSDEEEDEDDEMRDFIDDGDCYAMEKEDYSEYIREIFGYDRRKYAFDSEEEVEESSFAQQMNEELRSAKIGFLEDLEDMRQEEEEKRRKAQKKKSRRIVDEDSE